MSDVPRYAKACLHRNAAGHHWRIGSDADGKQIFDACVPEGNVEFNIMSVRALQPYNLASRRK
jgi:hypothetical protein